MSSCSPDSPGDNLIRSEEHTSELQSRENLVCRLLLEKKKKKTARTSVKQTQPRLPASSPRRSRARLCRSTPSCADEAVSKLLLSSFFFFNDTATTEIYTLSLHDALPINTLYNGIKVGPSSMTSRVMDTGNLERIEILKGPASLLSGEGATGGAINYVSRTPHTGPIVNESFVGWDSFNGYRAGFGSGGSTTVKGLDYRFDLTRSSLNSFIDDTYNKLFNVSGQLNYRVNDRLKVWAAVEYKEDKDRFYWGTPLVPANLSGIVPTTGIVSGLWTQYWLNGHTGTLNPVTIDARTLRTTYNVLDN